MAKKRILFWVSLFCALPIFFVIGLWIGSTQGQAQGCYSLRLVNNDVTSIAAKCTALGGTVIPAVDGSNGVDTTAPFRVGLCLVNG